MRSSSVPLIFSGNGYLTWAFATKRLALMPPCEKRVPEMQRALQITFNGIDTSPVLEELIGQRMDHLETLYPRSTGCRIVVEIPHRASETAKAPIAVSVEADIPDRGGVIFEVLDQCLDPAEMADVKETLPEFAPRLLPVHSDAAI
jgi:hypothetical protein